MKVWIDGCVVDGEEARIPVTDHGLLYGDGIFEGIRVYGRRVFRLGDHLRRFGAAARAIGLELPGGLEAIRRVVLETARAYVHDRSAFGRPVLGFQVWRHRLADVLTRVEAAQVSLEKKCEETCCGCYSSVRHSKSKVMPSLYLI